MRFTSIALAAAAAALLSIPAWAHHSHANYNTNEFTTVSGTITEVVWTNPHVWIYMEVANGAGPTADVGHGGRERDLPDARRLAAQQHQAG